MDRGGLEVARVPPGPPPSWPRARDPRRNRALLRSVESGRRAPVRGAWALRTCPRPSDPRAVAPEFRRPEAPQTPIAELTASHLVYSGFSQAFPRSRQDFSSPAHNSGGVTKMLLCDFHVHTTYSDGDLPLPEVVDLFGRSGHDVIAITDHIVNRDSSRRRRASRPSWTR